MKKFTALAIVVVMLFSIFAIRAFTASDPNKCILIQAGNTGGSLYCGDMIDISNSGYYTVNISGVNLTNTSASDFFVALKSGNTSSNGGTETNIPNNTVITVTSARINGIEVGLRGKPTYTITESKIDYVCKFPIWGTDIFAADMPETINSIDLSISVEIPGNPLPQEIVVFNDPNGDSVGVVKSWDFFGVGDFWGYNADLNISFEDIMKLVTNGGARFSFVYSGTDVGTPKICFTFNQYDNVEINAGCTVESIGDGKYRAVAEIDDLVAAWAAAGKSINDPDVKAFLIQPWASDFKLYSASFFGLLQDKAPDPEEPDQPVLYDSPVTFGLYPGGWDPRSTVEVTGPGVYSLTATVSDGSDWMVLKNVAGQDKPTSIPAGTVIRTTKLKINGVDKTFDNGKTYFDYTVKSNGEVEIIYWLFDTNHVDDRPSSVSTVEVTFVVDAEGTGVPDAPTFDPTDIMGTMTVTDYCPEKYVGVKSNVTYGVKERKTYYSTTCEKNRPVIVALPANYNTNKKYPVMYVLHGIYGHEDSMVNEIFPLIQNMMADGTAEDMILVFPYMFASKTKDECDAINEENSRAYDNFLNDLVTDLMPFIEANYSVATGKNNTAVYGFSMGGRETLAIGLTYPDKFGYIGAACPAPGLVPGRDWAMEHYGQFQEDELRFGSEKPYLLMIGAGDHDGTVGSFPESYHNIFNRNNVQHIWYVVDSDHGYPATSSVAYNLAKYAFKAADQAVNPGSAPEEVFYSPHTGSDTTGDGTMKNPFKTESKARSYASSFADSSNTTILEFMMTVNVYTGESFSVSAPTGTVNMIGFGGNVDSYYFKGDIKGTGYDTQKWGVAGAPTFSARYFIEGTDYTGAACSMYIENVGDDLEHCTPTIFTDSSALSEWNTAKLRAIVIPGWPLTVNVFKIH